MMSFRDRFSGPQPIALDAAPLVQGYFDLRSDSFVLGTHLGRGRGFVSSLSQNERIELLSA